MSATWIVPAFNEVEDRKRGFSLRLKSLLCEKLALERSVEAFAHRVVVAVSDRAHRSRNAGRFAALAERDRRVL